MLTQCDTDHTGGDKGYKTQMSVSINTFYRLLQIALLLGT